MQKRARRSKSPTVIDLFCGAGGFSEGFRQQGFEIIAGYDHWKTAVDTFSFNFGFGKGILIDLLELEQCETLIENLPDSDVILGSPPCVSFSSSNQSGKADKTLGIRLTKVFFKVVAIKKHMPRSMLKAWFMENVVGAVDYVSKDYSFSDLGLTTWAEKNGLDPHSIAISLTNNHLVVNSADFGVPQQRVRAVAGEMLAEGRLVMPELKCSATLVARDIAGQIKLSSVRQALPPPNCLELNKIIVDPLYKDIKISLSELSDHFYDTGLYQSEWMNSKFQKVNHPYMGKMSFPENENKPSRTITATTIGTSREAIIYKSEYNRIGNGEYRRPTVRESATLMSFPITYQFIGSESSKCRLVGNAVCPAVSSAFAATVRKSQKLKLLKNPIVQNKVSLDGIQNLNTFREKQFNNPPKKKSGAKFRRHPFKDGNITVTLSNYDIIKDKGKRLSLPVEWITSIQYGNGNGFPNKRYPDGFYKELEPIIKEFENGEQFINLINNDYSEKIADSQLLQEIHEQQLSQDGFYTPVELLEHLIEIVDDMAFVNPIYHSNADSLFMKDSVPKRQVLALYAINKICSEANKKT